MITNVEMINFPVGNAYCQYHKKHFQFHKFFSKLNTQRAVAVVSWVTEDELLPRRAQYFRVLYKKICKCLSSKYSKLGDFLYRTLFHHDFCV